MSWDLYLETVDVDGNEHECGSWNYTHNTNPMIAAALDGYEMPDYWVKHCGPAWFDLIHGKTAKESQPILDRIIEQFEAEPEKYKAMNPENGWGSYDTLLPELKKIAQAAHKYPSAKWRVWG